MSQPAVEQVVGLSWLPKIPQQQLREQVYGILREGILKRQFPPGSRLDMEQLETAMGISRYFYAWSGEELPNPDLESVTNREWLWERPYTLVELQHLQADDATVGRLTSSSAGFAGFDYADPDTGQETLVSIKDPDQVI